MYSVPGGLSDTQTVPHAHSHADLTVHIEAEADQVHSRISLVRKIVNLFIHPAAPFVNPLTRKKDGREFGMRNAESVISQQPAVVG